MFWWADCMIKTPPTLQHTIMDSQFCPEYEAQCNHWLQWSKVGWQRLSSYPALAQLSEYRTISSRAVDRSLLHQIRRKAEFTFVFLIKLSQINQNYKSGQVYFKMILMISKSRRKSIFPDRMYIWGPNSGAKGCFRHWNIKRPWWWSTTNTLLHQSLVPPNKCTNCLSNIYFPTLFVRIGGIKNLQNGKYK